MINHYLYILTNQDFGPFYIDATSDLKKRLKEHRSGHLSQAAFRIDKLIYAERFENASKAAARVSALRGASREWVQALIERQNPDWSDLTMPCKAQCRRAA